MAKRKGHLGVAYNAEVLEVKLDSCTLIRLLT